jgi:hypothetical protein
MATVQFETESVRIPLWATDLSSFRRWADSEESPDKATVCYLRGEVWVETSKEHVYSHNQVKTELARVLAGLVKQHRLGRYFSDGLFVTNIQADLCSKPDGTFVGREAFAAQRVRLIEGSLEGFVEIEGIPDMVLEVVSGSSATRIPSGCGTCTGKRASRSIGWSTAVASGLVSTFSAIRPAAIPRRANRRAGWSPPCSVTRSC